MSKHPFSAQIGKVLKLVIHSIYTNKEIFMRELISNSSDACDKFRYFLLKNSEKNVNNHEENLQIKIKLDKENSTITITDNGIGMTEEELIQNLGSIAHSGTQAFLEQLEESEKHEQIGQFGVGFYSSFMVAEKVIVSSTKASQEGEESKTFVWSSDGSSGFEVYESKEKMPRGTIVQLKMKPEESDFIDKYRLRHIISTYSDHIAFPIVLIDENGDEEVVNSGSALWIRPARDISENEYNEFYRYIAQTPHSPWLTMHNKVEGNIEYTSLLYIPSTKPYDLFHQDRKSRLKLYIQRVFITDEAVSLVPSYLRFLRGVVDSNDLPLNISREGLQYNNTVHKIKKSLVKRVLGELKKKSESDFADFMVFWKNFGEVMKEGLCENALEEKEQILDICHFYSTYSEEEMVSLQNYIDRMVEGQEQIFYITGDNLENMRKSPQIEGLLRKGIEVLLLKDGVDDFWIHVVNQYKNYELKNVVYSDVDVEKISNKKNNSERNDDEKEKNNDDEENIGEAEERIVKLCKQVLGKRVKDVKISKKLIDSPACLSVPEGAMSGRMEKMLLEQKQLHSRSAKILEINCKHMLLKKLEQNLNNGEVAEDIIEVLFGQACIADGDIIDKPHDLVLRMNRLITAD